MKALRQIITDAKGDKDVYDAASACNALTSSNVLQSTTVAMIDIVRSPGVFDCKAITGLNKNAQRSYHYADDGSLTHVTLHPQSFRAEESKMTSANILKTTSLTALGIIPPPSHICVVNAQAPAAICNKKKIEFAATKAEVKGKKENKKAKTSKKSNAKRQKNEAAELNRKLDSKNRGMFPCNAYGCSFLANTQKQLDDHISRNEHTCTTSFVRSNRARVMIESGNFNGSQTLPDVITRMCLAESQRYSRMHNTGVDAFPELPSVERNERVPILEGYCNPPYCVFIQDREPGFARKSSSKRFAITSKMLRFVIFCFKQGIKTETNESPRKLSPEKACELQAIHGTSEGVSKFPGNPYWNANANNAPTFVLNELLEIGQMKAYFGSNLPAMEKSLANRLIKEGAVVAPTGSNTTNHSTANVDNASARIAPVRTPVAVPNIKTYAYWQAKGYSDSEIPQLVRLASFTVTQLKEQLTQLNASFNLTEIKWKLIEQLFRQRVIHDTPSFIIADTTPSDLDINEDFENDLIAQDDTLRDEIDDLDELVYGLSSNFFSSALEETEEEDEDDVPLHLIDLNATVLDDGEAEEGCNFDWVDFDEDELGSIYS